MPYLVSGEELLQGVVWNEEFFGESESEDIYDYNGTTIIKPTLDYFEQVLGG